MKRVRATIAYSVFKLCADLCYMDHTEFLLEDLVHYHLVLELVHQLTQSLMLLTLLHNRLLKVADDFVSAFDVIFE